MAHAAAGSDEKPVVIRMPSELHAQIKERAELEERSMAQTMRRALRFYIEAAPLT